MKRAKKECINVEVIKGEDGRPTGYINSLKGKEFGRVQWSDISLPDEEDNTKLLEDVKASMSRPGFWSNYLKTFEGSLRTAGIELKGNRVFLISFANEGIAHDYIGNIYLGCKSGTFNTIGRVMATVVCRIDNYNLPMVSKLLNDPLLDKVGMFVNAVLLDHVVHIDPPLVNTNYESLYRLGINGVDSYMVFNDVKPTDRFRPGNVNTEVVVAEDGSKGICSLLESEGAVMEWLDIPFPNSEEQRLDMQLLEDLKENLKADKFWSSYLNEFRGDIRTVAEMDTTIGDYIDISFSDKEDKEILIGDLYLEYRETTFTKIGRVVGFFSFRLDNKTLEYLEGYFDTSVIDKTQVGKYIRGVWIDNVANLSTPLYANNYTFHGEDTCPQ